MNCPTVAIGSDRAEPGQRVRWRCARQGEHELLLSHPAKICITSSRRGHACSAFLSVGSVQHELNGDLDLAQDVDSMKQTIAEAERLGIWVMPDMHNYCRYTEVVKPDGTEHLFGESDVLTKEAFADVWRKLANEFKDFSNIWGYDIMNEPYGMDYAYWKEYAQAAINAIREVDTETPIVIEGCQYASASNWPTLSDDLKNLTDPSDKLVFSAHCYFDNQSSGLYDGTYDEEVTNEDVHINRLSRWVNWLKENNKQGILANSACRVMMPAG